MEVFGVKSQTVFDRFRLSAPSPAVIDTRSAGLIGQAGGELLLLREEKGSH